MEGTIRDLSGHVEDINGAAITPTSLAKVASIDWTSLPAVDGSTRLGACVGDIGKFMCIGLNYTDHAEETGHPIPEDQFYSRSLIARFVVLMITL
jgi:2-keto-4-pentenoate hydratase/2-oxohepta-3-ene-1,7-dioic acid hydratase (catechol pathway)